MNTDTKEILNHVYIFKWLLLRNVLFQDSRPLSWIHHICMPFSLAMHIIKHSTNGGNEEETRKVLEILMKFGPVGNLYRENSSRFAVSLRKFKFFLIFLEFREIVFNRSKRKKRKNWFQVLKRRNCWARYCCHRTGSLCANRRTKLTGSSRSKLNTLTWGPITSLPTAVKAWINGWTHWHWRLSFRTQARKYNSHFLP